MSTDMPPIIPAHRGKNERLNFVLRVKPAEVQGQVDRTAGPPRGNVGTVSSDNSPQPPTAGESGYVSENTVAADDSYPSYDEIYEDTSKIWSEDSANDQYPSFDEIYGD